jgi:hypothetical protein
MFITLKYSNVEACHANSFLQLPKITNHQAVTVQSLCAAKWAQTFTVQKHCVAEVATHRKGMYLHIL